MKKLLDWVQSFLDGNKTYVVSLANGLYYLGVKKGVIPESPEIQAALGVAFVWAVRSALKKIEQA